jgi:hypothetical protein
MNGTWKEVNDLDDAPDWIIEARIWFKDQNTLVFCGNRVDVRTHVHMTLGSYSIYTEPRRAGVVEVHDNRNKSTRFVTLGDATYISYEEDARVLGETTIFPSIDLYENVNVRIQAFTPTHFFLHFTVREMQRDFTHEIETAVLGAMRLADICEAFDPNGEQKSADMGDSHVGVLLKPVNPDVLRMELWAEKGITTYFNVWPSALKKLASALEAEIKDLSSRS